MTPKFRGNTEDWLDDERAGRRVGKSKGNGIGKQKAFIPIDEGNAVVEEVFPNQCRVLSDDGKRVECNYRRSSIIGTIANGLRERAPVAVGDRVKMKKISEKSGVIEGVCLRVNQLLRPAPDRMEKAVHVIAANVDILVIVTSACEPAFSPGLVDRYLVVSAKAGIFPVICINKIDLAAAGVHEWDYYRTLGIEVIEISAKQNIGLDLLREKVAGKTVVFSGHSGVGKTSVLAALLERKIGKIAEVSGVTGKGRHTTTTAVMHHGAALSRWIDTPGIREFGLSGIEADELVQYFPELADLSCVKQGCHHFDENFCVAKGLPRYPSYRRIYESLKEGKY